MPEAQEPLSSIEQALLTRLINEFYKYPEEVKKAFIVYMKQYY